ncbi:MAG: ribbon-helix-helix protein, CopG family [Thermodesulfovibrionales bacterium]|nr:ribbon-helix-helix protein, CopG family [Thermodesulfovibrionales bacterium]
MKRTTIFADETLLNEIKEISQEENRSIAEVLRDAMQNYIKQKRCKKKRLSFIGIGKSSRKDIAERHEEVLWQNNTK